MTSNIAMINLSSYIGLSYKNYNSRSKRLSAREAGKNTAWQTLRNGRKECETKCPSIQTCLSRK